MIQNILSFFEESAEAYPRKTVFSDEHTGLIYRRLSNLSMRIGSVLAWRTDPCRSVPMLTEKNVFTLGVFIGIVRAGCFYVCLDVDQSAERLNRILDTLETGLMIADKESLDPAVGISFSGEILFLEDLKSLPDDALSSSFLASTRRQAIGTDPLYETFTSGSTGVPKGVAVSHHSITDFVRHSMDLFHITQDDVIGNQASFGLDVSVKDIYSVLKTGATMEIIPKKLFSIPTNLLDYLCDRKTTAITWAVSVLCITITLKGFTYCIPSHLNRILFSGEVMSVKHLSIWRGYLSNTLSVNLYDSVEITCNCIYYVVDREFEPETPLSTGVPFPNETASLLDESDRLVTEPGQNGELCVAGATLALDYYGDPKRVATALVQNPLDPYYPEIIYRIGDLACYGRGGLLYFNGRRDFRVKHMGHRIKLGGAEAVLETVGGADRAVCLFLEGKNKIAASYKGITVKRDIAVGLEYLLLRYMFPALYRSLTEFPRTKSGKVDRQAFRRLYG